MFAICCLAVLGLCTPASSPTTAQQKSSIKNLSRSQTPGFFSANVVVDGSRELKRFIPELAFGAGLDGHEHGELAGIFTKPNAIAMRSMGLRSLTYRLRTELGVEAWHWNPRGTWSDPTRKQGYWLSDSKPGKPILTSFGYSLPRRGSTFDQANNRGYSRIDDGDSRSFWKSNPYLDQRFTGESNSKHPQWLVVDFGDKKSLDQARIHWGTPYATRFRFEYWDGAPRLDEVDPPKGAWRYFPLAADCVGKGGIQSVRLCDKPISAEYVRIWLDDGSGTAPVGSHDVRDRLGFAIRELSLGQTDSKGAFHDAVVHRRDSKQTEIIVSSTDPWHRSIDRDRDVEHPGFDLIEKFGFRNGLPMLVPVPVLFGDPQDAANELAWFRSRGIPLKGIEMGEEPDGQMTFPEDYGALYLQVADRLRKVDSKILLGGPCFQTTQHEYRDWPDLTSKPWLRRFLNYLEAHDRTKELGFFSFEWYPFDDVTANPVPQLLIHDTVFDQTIRRLTSQGLTHDIPWYITEYGYSAFAGPSEVELPGALLNADIVGEFLTVGGDVSYLYGYEPGEVIKEKKGAWGNLMDLQAKPDGGEPTRLPTYYSAWLLVHAWCGDQNKAHTLNAVQVTGQSQPWVQAFAVSRPDGRLAVMLINRNPASSAHVTLNVAPGTGAPGTGALGTGASRSGVLYQYGHHQYEWKPNGEEGRPARTNPPARTIVKDASRLVLPPFSLSVLVVDEPKVKRAGS